jgi:hypothetical protein
MRLRLRERLSGDDWVGVGFVTTASFLVLNVLLERRTGQLAISDPEAGVGAAAVGLDPVVGSIAVSVVAVTVWAMIRFADAGGLKP